MLIKQCQECGREYFADKCDRCYPPGGSDYAEPNYSHISFHSAWVYLLGLALLLITTALHVCIARGEPITPSRVVRVEVYTLDDGRKIAVEESTDCPVSRQSIARQVATKPRTYYPVQRYQSATVGSVRQSFPINTTRTIHARVADQCSTLFPGGCRTGNIHTPATIAGLRGVINRPITNT